MDIYDTVSSYINLPRLQVQSIAHELVHTCNQAKFEKYYGIDIFFYYNLSLCKCYHDREHELSTKYG